MFARFDTIHERDRQTDGQTPHDGIGRAMHSVARQKSDVSDHTMQDVEYLLFDSTSGRRRRKRLVD